MNPTMTVSWAGKSGAFLFTPSSPEVINQIKTLIIIFS